MVRLKTMTNEIRIKFGMIRVSNEEFRTVEYLRPKLGIQQLRDRLDFSDCNGSERGTQSCEVQSLVNGVTHTVRSAPCPAVLESPA